MWLWGGLGLMALWRAPRAALAVPVLLVTVQRFMLRPRDARPRGFDHLLLAPRPLAAIVAWQHWLAELLLRLVPAPLRAAELATAHIQSQVLFALLELDIPQHLQRLGSATAEELGAACGVTRHVDRLARLLDAAVVLGLLSSARPKRSRRQGAAVEGAGWQQAASGGATQYRLTAASSVLCPGHPSCMAAFVRLQHLQAGGMGCLAKGLREGQPAFDVWSGGATWWEWLGDNPDAAACFDAAMTESEHLGSGGPVLKACRDWGKAALVVDVAGGVGGFLAAVLAQNKRARGVVVDRPEQVERGQKWWAREHPASLERVQHVAGDVLCEGSIPGPADQGRTIYVLRMILHDWNDESCIKILRAVRAAVPPERRSAVQLAIVEPALVSARDAPAQTPTLMARSLSDVLMMMAFDGGRERGKAQFMELFEASGWRLQRLMPTTSIYWAVWATPV